MLGKNILMSAGLSSWARDSFYPRYPPDSTALQKKAPGAGGYRGPESCSPFPSSGEAWSSDLGSDLLRVTFRER